MLEIVSNVLEAYNEQHGINLDNQFPIRTTLLRPMVQQRGVVDEIYIYEADIQTEAIVTQVEKYKGESSPYSGLQDIGNIYYAPNHSQCWQRFGVCKEMFHCMIDRTEGVMVSTVEDLLKLFEMLVNDTTVLTGDFGPLTSEQRAELMAIETLFPVEFRQDLLNGSDEDAIDVATNHDFYMNLAQNFKIPFEYAALACQPKYVRAVTKLRGRLLDLN